MKRDVDVEICKNSIFFIDVAFFPYCFLRINCSTMYLKHLTGYFYFRNNIYIKSKIT